MAAGIRTFARFWVATVLAVVGLSITAPTAMSQPCPDIGVVFARGTAEPVGAGAVGQRFVDSLRAQAFPRTVGVHGVNYPASNNFDGGTAFTLNVADGIRDETNHLLGVASACPDTQMVLGGYSQGAVVTALATSGAVPPGVPPEASPLPIPDDVADKVAAVVLFGKPAGWSAVKYGVPTVNVGPTYAGKVLELCAPDDTICSGAPPSGSSAGHQQYAVNGMADVAAAFTVEHLAAPPLV